jgi:hypothetical protein
MELREYYRLLEVSETATDEEITRSFRRLAQKYHPDKNRNRIEWATRAMADLNIAYTTLMGSRFSMGRKGGPAREQPRREAPPREAPRREKGAEAKRADVLREKRKRAAEAERESIRRDYMVSQFVKIRETAKDALYRFFQFNLDNIVRREDVLNRGRFNEIASGLKRDYHAVKKLSAQTADPEMLEHFDVFCGMLFCFYRASECLNILDSYSNLIDVEAYRLFRKGDEVLHRSHKEIFYDRHNRGSFKRELAVSFLQKAEYYFRDTLKRYPGSTWAVETQIKLDYVVALEKYVELFFTGD